MAQSTQSSHPRPPSESSESLPWATTPSQQRCVKLRGGRLRCQCAVGHRSCCSGTAPPWGVTSTATTGREWGCSRETPSARRWMRHPSTSWSPAGDTDREMWDCMGVCVHEGERKTGMVRGTKERQKESKQYRGREERRGRTRLWGAGVEMVSKIDPRYVVVLTAAGRSPQTVHEHVRRPPARAARRLHNRSRHAADA